MRSHPRPYFDIDLCAVVISLFLVGFKIMYGDLVRFLMSETPGLFVLFMVSRLITAYSASDKLEGFFARRKNAMCAFVMLFCSLGVDLLCLGRGVVSEYDPEAYMGRLVPVLAEHWQLRGLHH